MKAVVMAGGEGTRLRPLTSNQPKPMILVGNRPVMDYIIELLKRYDFTDIVVTLHFLPQLIRNYFGSGSELGVSISYVTEEEPLGTAGSVKNAEEHLSETFLVISGDALTDFDLKKVVEYHRKKKSMVTIVLKKVENPLEYGIVITDESGRIERFLEKPSWGEVFSDTVNTGIYVLEPDIFEYIPEGKPFDFSKDLFPLLLEKGFPLYGYIADGYWCDIGNLDQYRKANMDLLLGRIGFEPAGIRTKKDVWIGEGALIDPEANLEGPAIIGQHVRVEKRATIGEFSVIGHNVAIQEGAHVHRAIIMDNSFVGSHAVLHNCIVGRNVEIKKGVRVEERSIIGDESIIGEDAVISHDVKIYPFKTVEAGAAVNRSIIWETRGVQSLFGLEGVSGLVNVDITAELALRLAMAFGSTLPKDSFVVCSRDASRAARMIKRAIMSGLAATGVNVRDIRIAPSPLSRFAVRTTESAGGIHINVSPFDPQSIQIHFYDEDGVDVSENFQRKIERYFFREDFRRAFYNEIGAIEYHPRIAEFYINSLCKAVDICDIKKERKKVVVDHAFGTSSLVFPHLVGRMNCDVISLNAHTDEEKCTLTLDEIERSLEEMKKTVEVFEADLGVLIDSASEKIFLIDDKARRISSEKLLLLFTYLFSKYEKRKGKIAVPLSATSLVEKIASSFGRKTLRVKTDPRALMKATKRGDVLFAATSTGGFIFSRFLPSFDALMSLAKLLEYLHFAEVPLSRLVDELPEPFIAKKTVYCPWEKKGKVIRRVVERFKGSKMELMDGVKVFDGDSLERWFLVVPDAEEPLVKIYSEGKDAREARARAEDIATFIGGVVLEE
jgi:mannose-1-phosphate guanylyltransferase/phosphomannomutase